MSVQVLADTHALIWYLFDEGRLEERRRISAGATERIRQACEADEPSIEIVAIDARIAYGLQQVPRADVPDMPDRIIAATAVSLGVPLVTRDGKIRASSVQTIRA